LPAVIAVKSGFAYSETATFLPYRVAPESSDLVGAETHPLKRTAMAAAQHSFFMFPPVEIPLA
jgi:hypothetical protein